MDWRHRGTCATEHQDPELFYPLSATTAEQAKAVCARCSVRSCCLEWALRHEDYGIWGGLSETERRALIGDRRRAERAAPRRARTA